MRLNYNIREQIISNAVEASTFKAEREALSFRSMQLSERVRLDSLGGEQVESNILTVEKEIELLMKKRSIPTSLITNKIFERSKTIKVFIPGGSIEFKLGGNIYMRSGMDLPNSDKSNGYPKLVGDAIESYGADHPNVVEYNLIKELWEKLRDKRDLIERNARAVVESFNTVEKLVEHWPEAKALIPTEKVSTPLPLSTNVQSLNNLIGLPK